MKPRIALHTADRKLTQTEKLELYIAQLNLSVRTVNRLDEAGYFTVKDLLGASREDLLSLPNFGQSALKEIMQSLRELELSPLRKSA